ncbi:rhomboid-like protein [uncultured Friedmanniella sp.]|uniref:rhomboid-like protein n=1 Tax=uncultured Friedmanniella sp. TaxID=335381 RepID=UPI0035CAD730
MIDPDGRAAGVRISHWLRRARPVASTSVTAGVYVGLFAATNALLRRQPAGTQQAWFSWASTDLVNLAHHPVGSMVLSALVDDSNVLDWIALGLIGLVAAGQSVGNLRCALLVAVAHVVGTLISEGILMLAIATGRAPSEERISLDIGPSYVIVAALTVGILYGRWPARIASAIAFALLAPYLFSGLQHLEVGPVGHCCAILIGVALGFPWRRAWRRHDVSAVGGTVEG